MGDMKKCPKCHKATYCGVECQKQAWKGHKTECRQLADTYAAEKRELSVERFNRGLFDDARQQIVRAVQVQRGHSPGDDIQLAISIKVEGMTLIAQGRSDTAMQKLTEAHEMFRRLVGDMHGHTAMVLLGIGMIHTNERRYARALVVLKEALLIQQELLGPDHVQVADVITCIANVHYSQGRFEKAGKGYDKALFAWRRKLGGRDDPDMGRLLMNSGNVLKLQNKDAEALALYEEALRMLCATVGDKHPDIAEIRVNIARVHSGQCKYSEALEGYTKALEIQVEVLGQDHLLVCDTHMDIAQVYNVKGEHSKVLKHFKKALKVMRHALGDDNCKVVGMQSEIAKLEIAK